MTEAVFYSFRRCPYAMRARMALHVSQIDYTHREILLRDKPQAMLDASPKGTVPVFVTSDGRVLEESLELMLWALEHNDPMDWLDCNREATTQLITANDGPFKHHLDRYKYASRYKDDAKRGDVDMAERDQAETHIQNLEAQLTQHAFLLGPRQSLADIAIFPFIRQFAHTDLDWWNNTPYAATRNWLARHIESDLFQKIMKKHPLWPG